MSRDVSQRLCEENKLLKKAAMTPCERNITKESIHFVPGPCQETPPPSSGRASGHFQKVRALEVGVGV